MRTLASSPRLEVLVLLAALGIFALSPVFDVSSNWDRVDWNGYADSASRWLGGGFLYGRAQLTGPYHPVDNGAPGFSYPPPAVLLFVPFIGLGYPAWAFANALVLATGLIALARREFQHHGFVAAAAMLLIFALSRPYIEGLAVGNVNVALAGLFAWAWALGRGSRLLPILAVAGGVIKPFLGALVFWTHRRGVIKSMLTAIGVAAALVLITVPLFGISPWRDFLTTGHNVQPLCDVELRAPMCVVLPYTGSVTVFLFVAYGVIFSSLAMWAKSELLGFALIVVAMLGVQLEIFNHTFLYSMVLGAAAGSRLVKRLSQRRKSLPAATAPSVPDPVEL